MIESETRQADWRRANPAKCEAHLAVQRDLKSGHLVKQACEVCGVGDVNAHHDLYENPLRVRWLCRQHHTCLHHYGEEMLLVGAAADRQAPRAVAHGNGYDVS